MHNPCPEHEDEVCDITVDCRAAFVLPEYSVCFVAGEDINMPYEMTVMKGLEVLTIEQRADALQEMKDRLQQSEWTGSKVWGFMIQPEDDMQPAQKKQKKLSEKLSWLNKWYEGEIVGQENVDGKKMHKVQFTDTDIAHVDFRHGPQQVVYNGLLYARNSTRWLAWVVATPIPGGDSSPKRSRRSMWNELKLGDQLLSGDEAFDQIKRQALAVAATYAQRALGSVDNPAGMGR